MRKADNLPASCAVVTKSGNLNFLEPCGPVQACNGTALPLPLLYTVFARIWIQPSIWKRINDYVISIITILALYFTNVKRLPDKKVKLRLHLLFYAGLLALFLSHLLACHALWRHFPALPSFAACLPSTFGGTLFSATALFGCSSKFSFRLSVLEHVSASVTVRRGSCWCSPDLGVFCVQFFKLWCTHATILLTLLWAGSFNCLCLCV